MSNLLIIGCGGHGKVVADAAQASGQWETIAFIDEEKSPGTVIVAWKVMGKFSDLINLKADFEDVVVAMGHNEQRLMISKKLQSLNFNLVSIIHPSAWVSPFANIGAGSVVLANASVNINAHCSTACIINTGAVVEHDCQLGAGAHVSPNASLAGNVHMGTCSWLGIGSSVRQNISIGAHVKVGAGAAVVADIADQHTVMGVPARVRAE